jgi:peptide-methionine (S)-S-oxide reductase
MNQNVKLETATLACGCFWCLEAVFREVKGVEKVVPGYAGGKTKDPTYEEVCTGTTGHAEAVQITFNPAIISYPEILDIFFSIHDATTLNRQGDDIGTQYRSAIFYHSAQQANIAEALIVQLHKDRRLTGSIVTQVAPFEKFYPAEDSHHDYFAHHTEQAYCQLVISPKLKKFRKEWHSSLKK